MALAPAGIEHRVGQPCCIIACRTEGANQKAPLHYRNGALRVKNAILLVRIPAGDRPVEKQVVYKVHQIDHVYKMVAV